MCMKDMKDFFIILSTNFSKQTRIEVSPSFFIKFESSTDDDVLLLSILFAHLLTYFSREKMKKRMKGGKFDETTDIPCLIFFFFFTLPQCHD